MYYIEDANVISNAVKRPDLAAYLEQKRRELEQDGFSHAIAPVLLVEIITGLAKTPEGLSSADHLVHFFQDQMRVRLLYPWDRPLPTMLPSPAAFALKTVLHVDSPKAAALNEGNFNRWAEIVLCAQSPEELWTTGVSVSAEDHRLYTIDRDSVISRYEKELRLHCELMRAAKSGNVRARTREDFARSIIETEGILLPKPREVAALSEAVDAAYRYHLWLLNKALEGYNPESDKNKGDAMDYAYLLYLTNPGIRFLTHDSRIKERVKDSPQAEQIIVLPQ